MPALSPHRQAATDGESGFVMVVALLIMVALTVLIAAVAQSSGNASNTTERITSSNQSLAAADAGVEQALFRLNAAGATGTTSGSGSLGAGRSYSYSAAQLTPPADSSCAGLPVRSPSGSTGATGSTSILEYCITSTGSSHGRTSKVQERVVASQSLFPVNGLFAVNGFTSKANISIDGNIGSNGPINIKGSGSASDYINGNIEYLPSAQQPAGSAPNCPSKSGSACTTQALTAPLPIPSSTATLPSAYASALASNLDTKILPAPGISGFSSASYTVNDTTNNSTYTLSSGTYYFCNLSFSGNSTTLQASITNGQPVVVYIDSGYDTGRCATASPSGQLTAKNTLTIQGSGNPNLFQIYFYGQPGCTTSCPPALTANNLTVSAAQIIAPYSAFTTNNSSTLNGTFVFGTVSVGANTGMNLTAINAGEGGNVTLPYYFPAAHQICNATGSC